MEKKKEKIRKILQNLVFTKTHNLWCHELNKIRHSWTQNWGNIEQNMKRHAEDTL